MSKEIPDIIRVAEVVRQVLHKMAAEGKIEAAAVNVKNLSWVVDMLGHESWGLTLENVEPSTVKKLTLGVIFELELIGLGWDDWDIYTEYPDEDGTCVPTA
jgi:hypothetical protein